MTACILTIAGSDSISGAGLQIDLKTAAAHGVHACCAVTAVTAQNTTGVSAIQAVEPDVVRAQVRSVFADVPPAAVKVGMLGSQEVARAVAEELAARPQVPVVLDPVLVATAGGSLASVGALEVIRSTLLPRATLVTPNLPEAAALSGVDVADEAGMQAAARALLAMGAGAVLVKGGHGNGEEVADLLLAPHGSWRFAAPRLPGEYHGTGCSLSAAIACNLGLGAPLPEAVESAHAYLAETLQAAAAGEPLGHGSRIFNPLHRLQRPYGAGVSGNLCAPVGMVAASP